MLTSVTIVSAVAASVIVLLVLLLVTSARKKRVRIFCPFDQEAREIVVVGNKLDSPHWVDVIECGKPGEKPLVGSDITCDKACLHCALPAVR